MRVPRRKPSWQPHGSRKKGSLPVFALVIASLFLFAVFSYSDNLRSLANFPLGPRGQPHEHRPAQRSGLEQMSEEKNRSRPGEPPDEHQEENRRLQTVGEEVVQQREKRTASAPSESCDVTEGRWVYDPGSRPLYKEAECGFLTEQVTCMRNGRTDDTYQHWRWLPHACTLPRFDARELLERLRNKRLMFVGDSLNRNQWESMVCLIQSVLPWPHKSLLKHGSLSVFRAHHYNATVEFYWAPFLVESNSDDPTVHSIQHRVIAPELISKHAAHWAGVHYLVFNTYIWWMNTPKMRVSKRREPLDEGWGQYHEIDRAMAYRRVLRTWSRWVEEHVDPASTMVFFMSASPVHLDSQGWGNPDGIKCALETLPVANQTSTPPLQLGTDWRLVAAAQAAAAVRRVPVHFVNVTAMSEVRKDGHTSVHTLRQGKLLTPEQQADPAAYADCIHWCLPGVPDTWNELLFARLVSGSVRE